MQHEFYDCATHSPNKRCEDGWEGRSCNFCDGGLALCVVCGAAEGELLPTCPGFKLNAEVRQACYDGKITDVAELLDGSLTQAVLDMWNALPSVRASEPCE